MLENGVERKCAPAQDSVWCYFLAVASWLLRDAGETSASIGLESTKLHGAAGGLTAELPSQLNRASFLWASVMIFKHRAKDRRRKRCGTEEIWAGAFHRLLYSSRLLWLNAI